jgi:hypothetical protein
LVGSVDRIYVVIILTIFIYQDQLTFYRIFHALLDRRLYYLWCMEVLRIAPSRQRGSRGIAYFIFSWVISLEMGLLGGNLGDLKTIYPVYTTGMSLKREATS